MEALINPFIKKYTVDAEALIKDQYSTSPFCIGSDRKLLGLGQEPLRTFTQDLEFIIVQKQQFWKSVMTLTQHQTTGVSVLVLTITSSY